MNSEHFFTFVWLRWRLLVRQVQRAGLKNGVLLGIVAVILVLGVLFFSVASFLLGLFLVPEVPAEKLPAIIMYVWDVIIVAFLITWASGLLAELQRSEALSMEKFLHLPVSLSGVFVINYVSSLASLTMALFFPIMAGFSLAVCFSIGPEMLLVLPLLAAFLLMVTAVSYQFQGWLAALMVNKRRRRTVIVVATVVFVLLCQVPNLLNFMRVWDRPKHDPLIVDDKRAPVADEHKQAADKERDDELFNEVKQTVAFINMLLPPGWLALGAMCAAEGSVWPALLGIVGMGLIGSASLWRAYRTTVRLYTGEFTARKPAPGEERQPAGKAPAAPLATGQRTRGGTGTMLEKQLPWVSEQAAVIALAGFRSLMRAPEAKMTLLTPVFLLVIFGAMMLRGPLEVPDGIRPYMGLFAIGISLISLVGFVGNQFGFDRGGFRVYVLSPAPRRDILLGKNLAVAPLAVALCILPVIALQIVLPVNFEYFAALPAQFVTMYLLFCLLANWLSLLGPMPIAAGSMKPTNIKLVPVLLQFLCIFLLPVALSPALLPMGIEYWLGDEGWAGVVPIYAISALILCAATVLFYWLVLIWQGHVLQSLEQQILHTITTKSE